MQIIAIIELNFRKITDNYLSLMCLFVYTAAC